jgi:hypothetical protein
MKHDKVRDMGCFVPIRKERFIKSAIANRPHFLKTTYFNSTILNL